MAEATLIPEGYVQDFITGKPVKDTPKEFVRQDVAKALFHEYGFPVKDMEVDYSIAYDTADGATKKQKIDIAIFSPEHGEHTDQNKIVYLIQVEAPGTPGNKGKKSIENLQQLMTACKACQFGLWTNGTTERYAFHRIEKRLEYVFEEIIDIPGAGQTLEDIDQFDKSSLKVAVGHSLLHTFKRCHNYVAANQGIKKDQAFWELLKLIFCKIYDERTSDLQFFVRTKERNSRDGQQRVVARIKRLFEQVKKTYNHIFRDNDDITLDPRVVSYIVSELQQYDLLRSPIDVKGTAYEEIVGDNLKGDRGQFFTPRNVIQMAVTMLSPNWEDRLLDPACGTGGFLVEALTHVIQKLRVDEAKNWADIDQPTEEEKGQLQKRIDAYATKYVFGVDFDPDLVKATQMNMVMNNDGQGHLFSVNSLDNPHNWFANARESLQFESMDVVLTNPPFGSKLEVDDPAILEMFELARVWEKNDDGEWWPTARHQKSVAPEILFIERCWHFLKPGIGRMGIVLPDGILSNPDLEYVRAWILKNSKILASIDLPIETFLPHTGTQTSMLFLQRKPKTANLYSHVSGQEENYPVFMAIAEKVGKDRRANPVYKRDPQGNELWFDVEEKEVVWIEEPIDDPNGAMANNGQIIVRNGRSYLRRREINQISRKIKRIDDDLPEIARVYLRFVKDGRIED